MKKDQWKDTFSDAMNETADEFVEETEKLKASENVIFPVKKRKGKIGLGLGIAAAVVLAAVGGLWAAGVIRPGEKEQETISAAETIRPGGKEQESVSAAETKKSGSAEQASVTCLVTPEYPERVKLTADYDSANWDAHYAEWQARRALVERYQGKLDAFYQESIPALLAGEQENPIASPANFYLSLALLAECADGGSRAEILDALHAGSAEELRETAKAFFEANYQDDGSTTSRMADSLWLNEDYSFNDGRLVTIRDNYYASVFQGDMDSEAYNEAFRDWLNEQTGGFLSDAVKKLQLHSDLSEPAVMNLLSTLYFQGKWSEVFLSENTEKRVFHGSRQDAEVDFMQKDAGTTYFYGENFGAVSLGIGEGTSMLLVLPDEGVDVRSLTDDAELQSLYIGTNRETYEKWEDKSSYAMVHLKLPKFDLSAENDLRTAMNTLGISSVFSREDADFSGLIHSDEPVYLSKAENDLRIMIDEEGVTAASLIQMELEGGGAPLGEVDFILDRPFFFVIRSQTGDILFTGIVEQL